MVEFVSGFQRLEELWVGGENFQGAQEYEQGRCGPRSLHSWRQGWGRSLGERWRHVPGALGGFRGRVKSFAPQAPPLPAFPAKATPRSLHSLERNIRSRTHA